MPKFWMQLVALSVLLSGFLMALAQGPEDKDKGPGKKGPPPKDKKGPSPWEPGKIIPPHVRDALELNEEQERRLLALEKEVRTKLMNIFTEEQKNRLKEFQEKGPKGPPKKKDDDNDPFEKGKDKGKQKPKDIGLLCPGSCDTVVRFQVESSVTTGSLFLDQYHTKIGRV